MSERSALAGAKSAEIPQADARRLLLGGGDHDSPAHRVALAWLRVGADLLEREGGAR